MNSINRQINKKHAILLSLAFAVLSLLSDRAAAAAAAAGAGTSVKTFDFGAGGDNPTFRSHARTFAAPHGVAIVIAVNYRTAGDAPISLVTEIEDAGSKITVSREAVADKTAKRIVFNIAANENTIDGCEKAWQVRVRSKSGEVPAARVFGDISFSFVDPAATGVDLEGESIRLAKGGQVTRQIGGGNSFKHPGVMNVKAGWLDSLAAQVLPLKFEIVRPDGTIAKSLIGYSTNSAANPKLDFNYTVVVADARQNGAWRIRITNATEHEIIEINPKVSFTKKCTD